MTPYTDTVIRVRYAETDQMGFAHHASYFEWFDAGRTDFCRHRGFEYKGMEVEDDTFIVVAKAACSYNAPARFDDVLKIRTRATTSQRRTVGFGYEIWSDAGKLIATGETLHVFCDRLGRPKSLPKKYHQYFPSDGVLTQNLR
jgi:acyl-CoA thioester hydrolase